MAKPQFPLATYVDYVHSLKLCKIQKDKLVDDKKKLEEMNVVLRRYKSKDEQHFNASHQLLLQKLETIV